MRTPEQRAHRRDAERARYARRVAERRCVKCNAGLQPEDGVRCVECVDRAAGIDHRYKHSAKGRATNAVKQRRWRADAKAAGRCCVCLLPAAPGRVRCDRHLAEQKAAQAAYLDRKEAS